MLVRVALCLTVLAIPVSLVLAGCAGSNPHSAAPSHTATEAAFRGSSPALAAVHHQSDHAGPYDSIAQLAHDIRFYLHQ